MGDAADCDCLASSGLSPSATPHEWDDANDACDCEARGLKEVDSKTCHIPHCGGWGKRPRPQGPKPGKSLNPKAQAPTWALDP